MIHAGHDPPLVLEKVTSAPSSSVAVRVILSASSSVTLPASTAPSPSLLRKGASLTDVTVTTKVSVAVAPEVSETVQVMAYVFPLSASPVKSPKSGVPPSVARPPVSAVSDMKSGMSDPVSTQTCVSVSPSTSVEAVVWNEKATSS